MKKSGKDKTLQYQKGGKIETIYVDNKKDPRLKSYNDSLFLYNKGEIAYTEYTKFNNKNNIPKKSLRSWDDPYVLNNDLTPAKIQPIQGNGYWYNHNPDYVAGTTIKSEDTNNAVNRYKKPIQPYKYKKPEPKPKIEEKVNETIVQLIEQNQPIEQLVKKDPTLFLRQERPTINGTKVYTRKDEKSEWIERDDLFIPKKEQGGEVIYNPRDKEFKEWYNRNTLEGQNNIPYSNELDYDYYSFYKNGEYKNRNYNIKKHFPDTYKRPNHKTFSTESIYSTKENPGGTWRGNIFIPPYQNGGEVTSEPTSDILFNRTYNKQIAVNKYNPGGEVSPYQIIQPSIYPQNYGINSPYFSQQPPLFDGQVGSPYYSTFDNYSQQGIRNNPISRDLMQRDPLAKNTTSTSAKSIGSEMAGIGNGIGPDGKGGGGMPAIDPISIGAKAASATFDATNMMMQDFSKEGSATRGWADASIKASKYAGAVTDIVKDVPIVGPLAEAAGKSLSFWIAGPMGARSANIRKEEMKHATDLNEFNERNSQTVLAPNNYGNYMAEFGINTNTEINPLIEEILNDFRNYLAQIQNT